MAAESKDLDRRRTLAELDAHYAGQAETILEPELPIVDPHHHLWDRPPERYMLDAFLADVNNGHNVVATVFVECTAMWRDHGPEEMRPVGETEFINGIAAMSASGGYGPTAVNAGIVSFADLRLGDAVAPVLEAHIEAGGGRFKGIRNRAQYHPSVPQHGAMVPEPGLLADPVFRQGLKRLASMGLVYDSWQFHPQIPEVADLASAVPDATIVLNHFGGVLGVGDFLGKRSEVFDRWKSDMADLARRPNVFVKLGGLGMLHSGWGFNVSDTPPGSEELAGLWKPYIETCVKFFGAERCMFESNFPPDKQTASYPVLWNAFKRIAAGSSASEKQALFSGTAKAVYSLDL